MGLFSVNKSKDQLLIESQDLFRQKKYNNARKLLVKALPLAKQPNEQFPIMNLIGSCLINQTSYKDGIDFLKRSLNLNHSLDLEAIKDTYYMIGLGYYYLKRYNNSLDFLTKYIEINPVLAQSFRLRGECYFKIKNYSACISDLESYFGKNKNAFTEDNFKPLIALSNSYLQTNETVKAAILLLKAIKIKPDDKTIKITLSAINLEYFGKDEDSDIPSLLIKGKLFSQIANIISPENSSGLVEGIQANFIMIFENARRSKPNMVTLDIINIGTTVSTNMYEIWTENVGFLNNIHKSYLSYEVAKKIHSFEFFPMDLDELHKSIFQSAFLLS